MTFKSSLLFVAMLVGGCYGSCNRTISGYTWKFNATVDKDYSSISKEECAEKCLSFSWCRGYTWSLDDSSGNICHIFHELNQQHACQECSKCESGVFKQISGVCSTEASNIIAIKQSSSEMSCIEMCAETSGCKYYSWGAGNIFSDMCFMFKKCSSTSSCEAWQSGQLQCVTDPSEYLQQTTTTTTTTTTTELASHAKSCEEIQANTGKNVSGVFDINVDGNIVKVYCDMDTDGGGWTVLQQRGDNGNPEDYFHRDWADYEQGFGDPEKDYWVGLRYWNKITQSEDMQLLIILEDFSQDEIEASYTNFKISDASDNYRMDYTAPETKYDSLKKQKGQQFTTRDRDNDVTHTGNCAEHSGAWWYEACHNSNLNGLYKKGEKNNPETVCWYHWKNKFESLMTTKMMVRTMKRKYNLPSKYLP